MAKERHQPCAMQTLRAWEVSQSKGQTKAQCGVMAPACNPNTWEVEAEDQEFKGIFSSTTSYVRPCLNSILHKAN